ncbi:MAG: accessory gene regulator ArgB-like protein [bacterium]|jgi:accessory gene regulator B
MLNTTKYARLAANYIDLKVHLSQEKKEIITYSLDILSSSAVNIFFSLLIASLFGVVVYTALIMLVSAFMRYFSGGAHCTTSGRCIMAGALTTPLLGLIASRISISLIDCSKQTLLIVCMVIFAFAYFSILLWAPADTPGKPISTKLEKTLLRRVSLFCTTLLAVICSLIIFLPSLSFLLLFLAPILIGVGWQSFSLSPLGYMVVHSLDHFFGAVGIN